MLNKLFLFITAFGNWEAIVVAGSLVCVYWLVQKKYPLVLIFLGTLIGTEASVYIIKHLVARPRPFGLAIIREDSFSFPSGHATIAVVFYGFLLLVLWRTLHKHTKRVLLLSYLLWVFLIGLSRIYLGVHYLSDVLAGYILGIGWLWIASILLQKQKKS